MSPSDRISDAIERVTGRPVTNGKAYCPAHEDEHPSLSISKGGGGKVLLNCHAGCSFESIMHALGMDVKEAFPDETSRKARIVATYDYTDENGALLSQAVRFEPKAFRQRKPDGRGRWDWNLNGTRRVLYNLPVAIRCAKEGRGIFIVEGEKDADALAQLNFPATTNPMGADKWREYSFGIEGVCPQHPSARRALQLGI